ncbi:MAG TPA: hypothetical protein VGG84_06135 [Gemmatimonadaceae bacterium]
MNPGVAMHNNVPWFLTVLLWVAVITWQLRTGFVIGPWWEGLRRIDRDDKPWQYWFMIAIQGVVFLYLVINGRSWPVR